MEVFLVDERKDSWCRNASVPGDEGMVSGLMIGRAPGVGMLVCLGMNERCSGR